MSVDVGGGRAEVDLSKRRVDAVQMAAALIARCCRPQSSLHNEQSNDERERVDERV